MLRRWPRSVAPLGVLCIAYAAACGGSGSQAPNGDGNGSGSGSGSTADNDASFGDDDATVTGEAGGDDATAGDADDEASDDAATGDAGDDASSDATPTGDDASSLDASPEGGADAGSPGTDSGVDGGGEAGLPDASVHDGGVADASVPGDAGATTSDAGPDASTSDGGATTSDGGACDFTGTWGAAITIGVTWAAGGSFDIVIAPGSGTIKQWILSTRTVTGTTVTDSAQVCGVTLPDFHGNPSLVDEAYGIRLPDSLFDDGKLTPFAIHGTLSGSTSTATYTSTPAAVLLGLTLANPTTAVWPATITTANDQDLDAKAGITATVAQGAGYSNVPLDFSVVVDPQSVTRSDRLYLAIRQVTSIAAKFSDCDHASGTVTVPQITDPSSQAKKYAIDSHVVGCGVAGSSADCTTTGLGAQAPFVDSNQPIFVPGTTTFASQRFPAGTSCMAVRTALP
ncbi:MAG TPA: hypothetical protein VH044_05995 [Polyangiaceae bacterium]|jgi:hypothetical protein|nr:hypothetical protein [Polyangiaceae bacterium]